MKYSELYTQSIEYWPVEISISDAMPLSDTGSQYFPTLSNISKDIEGQIDFAVEHWKSIGHWALFQAFHEEAKRLYSLGEITLNTRAVSPERISHWVLYNLKGEGWENELGVYEPFPA
jgi:hypothetical protein